MNRNILIKAKLVVLALLFAYPSLAFPIVKAKPIKKLSLQLAASIRNGDTILVVGGTSGVGQLVSQKLANYQGLTLNVRVSARDPEKARELLRNDSIDDFVRVDLTSDNLQDQLAAALKNVSAVVISVGTTAFPTMKWKGGNVPAAIDKDAVTTIARVVDNIDGLKKVVLLTSVGVERTKEMPFVILNLFGVLDAKRAGEGAVKASAKRNGFDYVIVRPGRLVGGPWTNYDLARLLQAEGGAENGVDVSPGDSLLGDCKRDACAEAILQCLTNDACSNVEFSIASNDAAALSKDEWTNTFIKLKSYS
ncbi:hypothetical protein MPSEU_000798400 [Mayamaea pseudoterrestris]|nr:hypothetical protein MPSEU_000798400 [Mayamaea pseudoterrestris]